MANQATIVSRTGHPVQRIVLRMPASFAFRAGQYLEVSHPDGAIPLSIASAPHRLPELHLHYLSTPGVPEASRMDQLLKAADTLPVGEAAGDVTLATPLPAPVLIAAGGTGIAQAMSFIDDFRQQDPGAPVSVLWCADRDEDFYLNSELDAIDVPWLRCTLIADAQRSEENRGLRWLQDHARRFRDPASQIVLAGGPGFVYAACDALLAAGIDARQMQSDVFSYAPRT